MNASQEYGVVEGCNYHIVINFPISGRPSAFDDRLAVSEVIGGLRIIAPAAIVDRKGDLAYAVLVDMNNAVFAGEAGYSFLIGSEIVIAFAEEENGVD